MSLIEKLLQIVVQPSVVLKHIWRRFPIGSFELRMKFDAFEKPAYAYGIYRAAFLAKHLGIQEISAVEFGVASGRGLIEMERIAGEVETLFGVKIHVLGFDTGKGLTTIEDYRDLPYVWRQGDFPMDMMALKQRLKKARLIIGDVRDTCQSFWEICPYPVGFISFDLDLYSSTKSAMSIFDATKSSFLPRTYLYFDDTAGDLEDCNPYTGEILAIEEFNRDHVQKMAQPNGLRSSWYLRSRWLEGIYVLHDFHHSLYNRYLFSQSEKL